MEKINKALSNNIYLDSNKGTIVKKYTQDKFKELYGNQEVKILGLLNFNIISIKNSEIEMEYIEHKEFSDENIGLSDLSSLVNEIKRIHSLPTKNLSISNFDKAYYGLLLKGNYPISGYMDEFEEALAKKALKILKQGKQVVLHNDIVEGNILKINGKIQLIDFEYSGVGNPIFDLASFCTERDLTDEQVNYFLNLYHNDINRDEFMIVCAFLQIFWARWAYFKLESNGRDIYKVIAEWKINKYNEIKKNFSI